MSTVIRNPILRGFNPDPSIVRVGNDYFIATSTFEWFPGVQFHHSRDLANWRLLTRPLRRASQLNLLGAVILWTFVREPASLVAADRAALA